MALVRTFVLRSSLFLLLFPLFAHAGEDWQKFPIGPFGPINNRDSSYAIPATAAQDALNVDITPGGKSVFKRHGYGTAFTLDTTSLPVHGVYDFFDSNGNEVNLFFCDTKVYGSVGGAAQTVLLSTAPAGATWQCTDSLGQAYCVNSSRSGLYKISGSTLSQIMSVVSTGTMIATAVDRLVMGGFSDAPARIDFSAAGDFTSWGSGSLGTSPAQFTINAPGAKITHLDYSFGRIMWFKDTSFGYILVGNQPFQTDWVIKTVSFDVGTNDNSYIYREGILYFRGKDAHIYSFDGYSYQRLTREISGTINSSQSRASNQWVQTTQADWNNGQTDSKTGVFVDTLAVPGSIQTVFPDNFSTFRDGTNGTRLIWERQTSGISQATASVSSNQMVFMTTSSNSGPVYAAFRTFDGFPNYAGGTTYYFEIVNIGHDPFNGNHFFFELNQGQKWPGGTPVQSTYWYLQFTSTDNGAPQDFISFDNFGTNATLSGPKIFNSVQFTLPAKCAFYIDSTNYQFSINTSSIIARGTHNWANADVYPTLLLSRVNGSPNQSTVTLSNFSVVPQTFTWSSPIHGAPALTSWDAFQATTLQTGASQTFGIRSATFQFVNASTWPYATVGNGSIPVVSVSTWFQINDYFTTTSTSAVDQLNDITQNWFEGNATDKAYATYFNDRLLWSVTTGTATKNNRILVYDMLNQGWLLYDLPSNGFYIKANKLYFGSSNGGYIYKYGDVENDSGAAINSYWKSKDYFGDDPFSVDELANISIVGKSVSNSTVTVSYTLNGSSTSSFYFPLSSTNSFLDKNKNMPAGTISNISFNIQVGNNAADQPWEIFGLQVGLRPKSWIPTSP